MIALSSASLVKLSPCTPEPFVSLALPIQLHGENVLNRQQLSGGLFNFAQILYRV